MKRICLIFNHLQHQDGVARSAIAIANWFAQMELADVTLIPLYKNDKTTYTLLEKQVKVHPVFGFFFNGMPHIIEKIPIPWINKLVFKEEFDIIIGFQYGLSLRCVATISQSACTTKYAWIHTYDEGLKFRKEYETIGKVICVSRCNSERLRQELPMIMTDYNYNPIDEKFIQKSGLEEIEITNPTDKPLFVSVGRMSPEKGYERLLDICKKLKDEGFKFELWLIGDGPLLTRLQDKTYQLHLNDCVKLLGRQKNPHKYTYRADVFVCSSFSEGYSTACTEAILLGIPVITTNVSGAEEIIEDAKCGQMVEMDDRSLYMAMREVLVHPNLIEQWKKMLQSSRERFYAETRIQRLINILGLNKE